MLILLKLNIISVHFAKNVVLENNHLVIRYILTIILDQITKMFRVNLQQNLISFIISLYLATTSLKTATSG